MKGVYIEINMFTSLDWSDPIILYDYYAISLRVVHSMVLNGRVGKNKNCFENPAEQKYIFFFDTDNSYVRKRCTMQSTKHITPFITLYNTV